MEITDFAKGTAWSILPESFEILIRKYYEEGVNVSEADPRSAIGNAEGSDGDPYLINDRIAVIPVTGPMSKRPSLFSFLFGGTSYLEVGRMISKAAVDPNVSGILLNIDSPGGVVNGTESLSDLIFNLRGEKPIVAYADGNMTSAAYWIGSAAEAVVAGPTSVLGSIGVLMIHREYSELEKNRGIKTTYLTAGKYKALGNDSEPLTLEAKEYFQDQLDYLYSIFVDGVARNRDVETEKVLTKMAEGKLFIGQQARDSGLADRVGTFGNALALVRTMIDDNQYSFNLENDTMKEIKTVEGLAEAFPALVLEVQDSAKKAAEEQGKISLTSERDRLVELIKIQFGEDQGEAFAKLVHSDISPELFKATKELIVDEPAPAKEDDLKAEILTELKDSGAENPGADGKNDSTEKDYMTVCREYQSENKCTLLEAQRAVDRMNPDLKEKYIEAMNA